MYDYDAIIVGSGAAGGLLASRLTMARKKVLLIEAGGFYNTNDFSRFEFDALRKLWWDYRYTSNYELKTSTPNEIALGMGRCVGGGTTIFDAVAYRVLPENVDEWARQTKMSNVTGDPISFDDIVPYFEKIEKETGVRRYTDWELGTQKISEGFSKLGLPLEPTPAFISPECDHSGCLQGCPTGAKKSSLLLYVIPAIYEGMELLPNTTVTKVILERGEDGRAQARGVVFRDAGGTEGRKTAKIVVLCGGTLQTPQILLNSDITDFTGETRSTGQIGRNMAAHTLSVIFGRFDDVLDNWIHHPLSAALMDYAPVSKGGFSFEMSTVNEGPLNFAQAIADDDGNPMYGEKLKKITKDYKRMAGILLSVHDDNDGRVFIDENGDEKFYKPVTVSDMAKVGKGRDLAVEGLRSAGAKETFFSTLVSHHVQGSCRMGEDPSSSVTNSAGEMHDVSRLFVCDGSSIPSVVDVNPALTIYVLAEMVSEHLLSERCLYFS